MVLLEQLKKGNIRINSMYSEPLKSHVIAEFLETRLISGFLFLLLLLPVLLHASLCPVFPFRKNRLMKTAVFSYLVSLSITCAQCVCVCVCVEGIPLGICKLKSVSALDLITRHNRK